MIKVGYEGLGHVPWSIMCNWCVEKDFCGPFQMRPWASASTWGHVLWWPMWSPGVLEEGVQKSKIAFSFHAVSLTFWILLRMGSGLISAVHGHRSASHKPLEAALWDAVALWYQVGQVSTWLCCRHTMHYACIWAGWSYCFHCSSPPSTASYQPLRSWQQICSGNCSPLIQFKIPTTLWWSLTLN